MALLLMTRSSSVLIDWHQPGGKLHWRIYLAWEGLGLSFLALFCWKLLPPLFYKA